MLKLEKKHNFNMSRHMLKMLKLQGKHGEGGAIQKLLSCSKLVQSKRVYTRGMLKLPSHGHNLENSLI